MFRIGQNDPGLVALSDVGVRRAEVDQAGDFSFLVDRTEIEVEPVLRCFGFGTRPNGGRGAGRATVGSRVFRIVVHNDPAERDAHRRPQRLWIGRVDDELLPLGGFAWSV